MSITPLDFFVITLCVATIGTVLFYRRLEGLVLKLIRARAADDERISKLEVNEFQHDKAIRILKHEIHELGADVGWDDDKRKTQVLKPPEKR